jgi:soluble lytic murein transglycosylase-like protein
MTNLLLSIAMTLHLAPGPMLVPVMATAAGVDPNVATCIACAESAWDTRAVGALGERGWFQIHPRTWAWARERMGADVSFDLAFNPLENTMTAMWLLRQGYEHWWSTYAACTEKS